MIYSPHKMCIPSPLLLNRLMVIVVVLIMTGCAITPEAFTDEELQLQAKQDKENLSQRYVPVTGPISLYEAMARALNHNLDLQLEASEKILAETELELTKYDQLPEFVTSLDYAGRSNRSGASSQSLITGIESLESSTSSDRYVATSQFGLTWNILDFGVSYIRAKQAADEILIAEEQKRKVVNRLMQDVRGLYWRAVSHDRLNEKLTSVLERVSQALEQSRKIEADRLETPLTALTYQRELMDVKRTLQEIQRELSLTKIQLAALMNLPPGADYELEIPVRNELDIPNLDMNVETMEELSLLNRSELREIAYQQRINSKETKAALLELLPGIDLSIGRTHSDNSFLFNKDWTNYGAAVSWNLVNVFKLSSTNHVYRSREDVLKARRMAMSMAVLTQVHVSLAQFIHSRNEFQTWSEYYDTQTRILDQVNAAAQTNSISQQNVIQEEMSTLVAEVRYDVAHADLQNAYADIYAAMGLDSIPENVDISNIKLYSEQLRKSFEQLPERASSLTMQLSSVLVDSTAQN